MAEDNRDLRVSLKVLVLFSKKLEATVKRLM